MKPVKHLSKEAKELVAWIRKDFFQRNLEKMDYYDLCKLSIGDLRTAASVFKSYDGDSMRSCTRPELVRFIAGYKDDPQQLLPKTPPPYGSLPTNLAL